MQSANNKMKEISTLWKLLYDKSLKYYETTYTSESYKVMNKIIEDFIISETKRINIINTNIREYFRFMKNEFHSLSELAIKAENFKDKYNKAMEKLKEDKEKLFKEQDINSWGLNENDLKHKDVFLKNKELAFNRMMPEESKNVLIIKNVYGAYLNSLIDEYERIRLLNGKKNKANTIKILKLFCDDYKYINISFENWINHLSNKVKDEEINDNETQEVIDDEKNIFNNNMNKSNQYLNKRQTREQNNFRNNNNNNYQDKRNNMNQPRRNNNQMNFNNNQNQMNMNMNKNNRMNNPNNPKYNNNNNNNQYNNRNNNQFNNNFNNNQQRRNNNNNNSFNANRNNQYQGNNNKNNNNQFNRNNNNQFNRKRNNQYNMNNNSNQKNRNRNQDSNNYEENNEDDFINNRNRNENKDIFNDEEEYDFSRDRNNNINIYEF